MGPTILHVQTKEVLDKGTHLQNMESLLNMKCVLNMQTQTIPLTRSSVLLIEFITLYDVLGKFFPNISISWVAFFDIKMIYKHFQIR